MVRRNRGAKGLFRESALAHRYLDGKRGIEIGASAHNPFNIPGCVFVDFTASDATEFKRAEFELVGRTQRVDVVAPAWKLPMADASLDYVLTSHVIEHCWDTIGTVKEWFRVLRPGGIVFAIIPHKERTFDRDRDRTTLQELLDRHSGATPAPDNLLNDVNYHFSVWITEDWSELAGHMRWPLLELHDVDDKVGNGFTVVLKRPR